MARERKDLNPADRHRKEQRKKELKKNKRERKEVQVFAALVRDPDTMAKAITELEEKYEEGKATAGDLEKLAQYKRTYKDIMKKREKAWKAHGEESDAAADKYSSALNSEQQHNITEQKEAGSAPQPTSSPYTPGFPPGLNPDVSSLPPPPPPPSAVPARPSGFSMPPLPPRGLPPGFIPVPPIGLPRGFIPSPLPPGRFLPGFVPPPPPVQGYPPRFVPPPPPPLPVAIPFQASQPRPRRPRPRGMGNGPIDFLDPEAEVLLLLLLL